MLLVDVLHFPEPAKVDMVEAERGLRAPWFYRSIAPSSVARAKGSSFNDAVFLLPFVGVGQFCFGGSLIF